MGDNQAMGEPRETRLDRIGDGGRRRTPGRPRAARARVGADEPETHLSPRDQIVSVAARLFAERGYAETTMSDIARAAGLRQSSLYYWFRRKELILQAALTVNRASLAFLEELKLSGTPCDLQLYRLIRFDAKQLCLAPLDFNEVERLAQAQPDEFADFWRDYAELNDYMRHLLVQGMAEGRFVEVDPEASVVTLLTLNEGAQKRFRYRFGHEPTSRRPFTYTTMAAEEIAELVASIALRWVLAEVSELDELRAQARLHVDPCTAYGPPTGESASSVGTF